MKKGLYFTLFVVSIFMLGCSKGKVKDIDGNIYKIVKIGNQVWMAENLKVIHYNDGSEITFVPSVYWEDMDEGAYCSYENDESIHEKLGYLYNWYAVETGKLAPKGWHVPTDKEWKELELALGMSENESNKRKHWRGTNEGSKLSSDSEFWDDGNLEKDAEFGTSGFNTLPGGFRTNNHARYNCIGEYGMFWTSTDYMNHAFVREINYDSSKIYYNAYNKKGGYSVRCVRD